MFLRVALFAMLALGIIGAATVAWMVFAVPAAPVVASVTPPPVAKFAFLVAAHPLRAGSLIKPEDLTTDEIAQPEVPAGASRDTSQGRSSLTGAMIRRSLSAGQPIVPEDVVRPGDHGFLAAVLRPEMRAISVAVDTVSGAAGLIWPGDRVDLILTQALEDPTLAIGRRVAAETVLSDVRVIAVDQQLVQGQAPDGSVAPANRTATLEVTAAQAERVLVAGRLGKLSLSVLSADGSRDSTASAGQAEKPPVLSTAKPNPSPITAIKDSAGPAKQTQGVTWAGDVSPALGSSEVRSAPVMVHVYQGGADSKEFHF